jgi:CRISPR/Cas system-associated exonuclease Cas4 (RecB family)
MTYAQSIIAGKYKLPISMLHKQAYCEYQIFLEAVRGVEIGKSAAMEEGTEHHAALDEEHAEKAVVMSLEDALATATKDIPIVYRDLKVKGKRLVGRIDEVQITKNLIKIIDDKPVEPGRKPWLSDIQQVWGYCVAYEEERGIDRQLHGAVRNREQEIVWESPYTSIERGYVNEIVDRIYGILKGERDAVPTKKPNKCDKCRFKGACDKCLVQ